jgi:hypothetical protein
LVELILKESARYGWGPRKILKRLRTRYPEQSWPARSTVFDILERHGRVQPRHRRRRWKHPGAAPVNTTAPNQIWTVDFKGQFLIYHLGWYRDGEQLAVEVLERIQSEFRESGKDLHLVTMPVSPNNGVHLTRSAPAGRRGPCR